MVEINKLESEEELKKIGKQIENDVGFDDLQEYA